jgi:hypothetical protein
VISTTALAVGPDAPVGTTQDAAVLSIAAAFVTVWAAASAPWWALALAASAATLVAFDPLLADGGFAMTVNNAGANRIDRFPDTEVDAEVVVDDDGHRRLIADVVVSNSAPTSGEPLYVIGNAIGAPVGTNRALLTFYGPPGLSVATVDDQPFEYGTFTEAGWTAHRHLMTLPPGGHADSRLEWTLAPAGSNQATLLARRRTNRVGAAPRAA